MKIKPHSNRKLLRHEPLEDRHLLAVDLTGGMSGGMSSALFPQEELAAPQVAPFLVQEIGSALVPGDIAEQETNFTAQEDAENIIAANVASFEQTSFDCIATMPSVTADVAAMSETTLAVFPQREEFRAFHTLQRVAPDIDENVLASLRRFNERKSHQAEHEHDVDAACCSALENFPQAREHGKISQLEFIDEPVAVDDDGMMMAMCGGGDDSGGDSGDCAIHFSGGPTGAPPTTPPIIDVYLAADNNPAASETISLSEYFCGCCTEGGDLSYTIACGGGIATASVSGQSLTITTTGTSGMETVTVTGANNHTSASMTIAVYSIRIVGFQIEERAWGEGTGDSGWHVVEDKGTNWQLLWQENEYRWKPIIEPAIASAGATSGLKPENIYGVRFSVSGGNGNFAAANYGPPSFESGGGPDDGAIQNPAIPHWPYATGMPGPGDHRIACSITVGNATMDAHAVTKVITMPVSPTPTANQPRVGVTGIASVQWVTRAESGTRNPGTQTAADLAKLESYGGAYRTFPEQTSPTSPNYDKVEARVTLAAAIPIGMEGTVHLRIFDPKNAHAETAPDVFVPNYGDNFGAMSFSSGGNKLTFIASDGTMKSKGFQITSAHAGDNYIVVAHPNSAGVDNYRCYSEEAALLSGCTSANIPMNKIYTWLMRPNPNVTTTSPGNPPVGYSWLDSQHQTAILTVWRTLNVECDALKYYVNNTSVEISPPSPLDYLNDFVVTELARACVVPRNYTPNEYQPNFTSHDPLSVPFIGWSEFDKVCKSKPGTNTPFEPNPSISKQTSGRDMEFSWNTKNFWTVRIVMISSIDNKIYGAFVPGVNTILLCYQEMTKDMAKWNSAYTTEQITTFIRHTLLHEIAHALITESDGTSGVRAGTISPATSLIPDNNKFLDVDIQQIQFHSRARN